LQTNPCIRHNFSTQVFRKRAAQLHYVGPELRYIFWPPKGARKCSAAQSPRNTFLLLQKQLTSGTELILIGWKIFHNEEHVQCDKGFASQPLANEPLHSSQLFDTSLQKTRGTTSLCNAAQGPHGEVVQRAF